MRFTRPVVRALALSVLCAGCHVVAGFDDLEATPAPSAEVAGGEVAWTQTLSAGFFAFATALATDGTGGVWIAGQFNGPELRLGDASLPGTGADDVFVAHLDSDGRWLESQSFGPGLGATINALAYRDGSLYVAGRYTSAPPFAVALPAPAPGESVLYAVKLTPALVPSHGVGLVTGGESHLRDMTLTGGGDVILVGYHTGSIDFGTGTITAIDDDAFVARLAGDDLSILWGVSDGGPGAQHARGVDAAADTYVAGTFSGDLFMTSAAHAQDVFVTRFEDGGGGALEVTHTQPFGSDDALQRADGVVVDRERNVVVAGTLAGALSVGGTTITAVSSDGDPEATDVFVAHLGSTLGSHWVRSFGDESRQEASALGVDGSGHIVVVGTLNGSLNCDGRFVDTERGGNGDTFVMKLDRSDGHCLWADGLVGEGEGLTTGVAVADDGTSFVSGTFHEALVLQSSGLTLASKATELRAFIVKFAP